jgi:glutathione S-transferase
MKLYFYPGACSLAPHIVLREGAFAFDLVKVDPADKKTAGGEDYIKINPKGYVPALRLDDGQVLTEVAVIVQYLADRKPDSGLAPRYGTMERYRLMEWLNFLASEVHKLFGPFFNPKIPPEWKENQMGLLVKRLEFLAESLQGKKHLLGDGFTVADAYLCTVLNWTHFLKIDLGQWPALKDYHARVAPRPAVQEALRAEGLTK